MDRAEMYCFPAHLICAALRLQKATSVMEPN